ncbi:MAG: SIS domain-containing protein [Spartobacteria bacterium]|nr:SIS domain-containing protein [Spartobacteria bacterium]
MGNTVDKYVEKLVSRVPELSVCAVELESIAALLCSCFRAGGKVLVCGNGGSAADAEHISGELLKQFMKPRAFRSETAKALGPLAEYLQPGLPVIPLVSFMALLSAYSNDCQPQYMFAQLVQSLGQPGDVLLALSTSGNSENICLAAETARAMGLYVVGMTGEGGGTLKALCDICLCAPSTCVYEIQEYHVPLYHTLCMMVEDRMF